MTDEQKKAMDCSRSLCVTAGAGAGKTYTLVERYIHLIKSGTAVPEILAVTFTEKAAAEMKRRVRGAVLKLEGKEWDGVKDDINWCRISTFHAFCAEVLRMFPLEAGVPPGFGVLEEVERDELLNEALDRLLSPPLDQAVEDALVRLLTDVPRFKLAEALRYMYDRRSEPSGPLAFDTKEDLLRKWDEAVRKGRDKEVQRLLEDPEFMRAVNDLKTLAARYGGGQDAGSRYLAAVAPFLEGIRPGDREAAGKVLTSLRAAKGRRGLGSEKTFGPDLERFRAAYDSLRTAFERRWTGALENEAAGLSEGAAAMMMDLKLVFAEFQRVAREMKRERNVIDFEDMIALVHGLFVNNPALVREEFTDRFKHILVDEFQDTDPIQSDIIWRMAGGEKAKERLFIVGDPKQSIYLFRNVDVSMFKDFQERIMDVLKGDTVHLDTNFRSSPQVIGLVNHVFGQLMKEARERFEFLYHEMKVSPQREGDRGSVELLYLPTEAEATEAEFVARRVQEMVKKGTRQVYWSPDGEHLAEPRPASYGDIAILLRAKTRLHEFEEALGRYGVPYRVHAGLGFFEREEIGDLRNLAAFLSNKEDDLSLYGVLRSPYFALSDEQLFRVSAKGRGPLWRKLAACSEESGDPQLKAARHALERWLRYAARLTVPRLLSRVFEESGIFAVYGGLPDGDLRIANLEKLRSMARKAQSSGFLTLPDFMQWLQLSMDGGAKEGLAPLAGGDDAVKIMTVHAAKGLEFPIVFVPEMNFYRRDDPSLIVYSEELGLGLDAPDARDGRVLKPTLAKRLIEAELALKGTAEKKRLLYVALTRAKDHLVMCGRAPDDNELKKELWINWILQTTGVGPEDAAAGRKRLGPDLELEIRTDPSSIRAEAEEGGGAERPRAEEMTPFIVAGAPLAFPPSAPVLSPSSASSKPGEEGNASPKRTPLPEITCFGSARCDERPAIRGIIIHEVLAGKDPAAVLRRYGISEPSAVREYSGFGERFRSGPVMKGATAAHQEIDFFAKVAGNFYSGRIDLLVQNEDGSWQVVDHKTGRFDGKVGEKKVTGYKVQMKVYQMAVESLVKKKVASSLYLVDSDRVLPLDDGSKDHVATTGKDDAAERSA